MYMIRAENDALYVGITTDIKRRFSQHQSGKGAKFFRSTQAKELVYLETGLNRSEASKREYQLKQLSKSEKEALAQNYLKEVS